MKKSIFVLTAIFALGLVSLPFWSTTARKVSIAEKFAGTSVEKGKTGGYNFDNAHSAIGFKIVHMGLAEIPGYFRDFTGTVNYNADDMTKSTVEFTAQVTSVDTGVDARDNHLRTADFFEVEKYPTMVFKSTKIEKSGDRYVMTGDLTIKDVTKPVKIPFDVAGFLEDPRSKAMRMGVSGETTIKRSDFNVGNQNKLPNGTNALSDDVKISLSFEAIMSQPPAKSDAE